MHNFFEAKGRKLEGRRAKNSDGVFGRGSHQLLGGLGSAVSSPSGIRWLRPDVNAFWCILSSKIASGDNFFDYLFQLKKWKWCTLKLEVCLIIENHRKYLTLD